MGRRVTGLEILTALEVTCPPRASHVGQPGAPSREPAYATSSAQRQALPLLAREAR
jgi:hypothetical protein